MLIKQIIHQTEEKMEKSIEKTMNAFSKLRTGRANSNLVEQIKVDYYGTPTALKQLAGISTPEARLIVIQPWDPTSIGAIEKSLLKSDIGITPANDGKVIRLNIPALTNERRLDMVKIAHKLTEEGKIAVRAVRRDANEQIKEQEKEHKIAEDAKFQAQNDTQKLTDKYIAKLDALLKQKELEIMEL
ncbi:MAG: ribosome recycling factor [Candidatus Omnitrophota bacterium]|nr:MAG: ribosome recycling factor [Candidatus Omnitrophota bacterium]